MTQSAQAPTFDLAQARAAYASLRAEIHASPPARQVDLDIPSVVATVLRALPMIEGLEPRIAMHLGTFDLTRFQKIKAYALALAHAHGEHLIALKELEISGPESTQHVQQAEKAADDRNKVFTLFIEAYEDARRAALYLAPHTADSWVPTLYPDEPQFGDEDS